MNRFRRRAFDVASAASLLLFAATAVFAVRAIWWCDWVGYTGKAHTASVASIGSFAWVLLRFDAEPPGGWYVASDPRVRPYFEGERSPPWSVLGLSGHTYRTDPSATSRFGGNRPGVIVVVPYWMLALAAGLVPGYRLWRRRRAAKFAAGHCQGCGYDLRATPDRCPECGAMPAGRIGP